MIGANIPKQTSLAGASIYTVDECRDRTDSPELGVQPRDIAKAIDSGSSIYRMKVLLNNRVMQKPASAPVGEAITAWAEAADRACMHCLLSSEAISRASLLHRV